MLTHDPGDEPCFLTPEDDPSMLDPPREEPVGPEWWEGRWPEGGINSLVDLKRWVESRLNEMIGMNWTYPDSLGKIGRMAGRQAVKNATRYLARTGRGDHPARPVEDQLDRIEYIETALETILRFIDHELETVPGDLNLPGVEETRLEKRPEGPGHKPNGGPPKRSWTQADLDGEIRKFKAQRASTYTSLVEGVRAGKPGAIAAARKTYGRNAIANALGVKSKAMVSKSVAWREIATELQLFDVGGNRGNRPNRIGLGLALEENAEAQEDVLGVIVNKETISLIEKHLPRNAAEALVNRLHLGDLPDEEAREIVNLYRDQTADKWNHKAY